jgi:3-isopropylmalate/(R)-2-methylmalate dehydratase small subunit
VRRLPTVTRGSGPRFVRHTGVVAPLPIDVDSAIRHVLDGSEDPDSVLDQEIYRDASILLAGEDFDAGDTPVSAVTRLAARGIRSVIAPGFEPAFYNDSVAFGLLPVTLGEDEIEKIADRVVLNPGVEMTVDLERQVIEISDMEPISFSIDPRTRTKLLQGLNDLDEMLQHSENVVAFRDHDRNRRPWVYDWRDEVPPPATLTSRDGEKQ